MYKTIYRIKVYPSVEGKQVIQYLYDDFEIAKHAAKKIADYRKKKSGWDYFFEERKIGLMDYEANYSFEDDVLISLSDDFWLRNEPDGKFHLRGYDFHEVFNTLKDVGDYIKFSQPAF